MSFRADGEQDLKATQMKLKLKAHVNASALRPSTTCQSYHLRLYIRCVTLSLLSRVAE